MNLLSDYLRKQTSKVHQRIERSSWSQAVLNDEMQTKDYGTWLQNFHSFLASCEYQVQVSGILDGADIPFINRSNLISLDLEQIGLKPSPNQHILSDLNAWACLYVMEGSQMGGLTLFRHLNANCSIPKNALNYFGYELRMRPKRWLKVQGLLNTVTESDHDKIASDAITCFERLDSSMQPQIQ